MTALAPLAFAYARTRALRGALLDAEDAGRLRSAEGAAAQVTALHALGIEARDPAEVRAALLARFAADADKLVRAWPIGRGLLLAVVGLLEIENLKLVFRGGAGWDRFWLPLGRVGQLPLEPLRDALSLREAVQALQHTPYAAIGAQVLRAHEQDHAAAELALDRWASLRLLNEGRRAGGSACELALRVVRERDLEMILRKAFALQPGATVLLRDEMRAEALQALVAWTPASGPLASVLPRKLLSGQPADLDALRLALRRARGDACVKAFLGPPFQLATAVALLLLRIEEIEAAGAIAEARWDEPVTSEALRRAIAGSSMGV